MVVRGERVSTAAAAAVVAVVAPQWDHQEILERPRQGSEARPPTWTSTSERMAGPQETPLKARFQMQVMLVVQAAQGRQDLVEIQVMQDK